MEEDRTTINAGEPAGTTTPGADTPARSASEAKPARKRTPRKATKKATTTGRTAAKSAITEKAVPKPSVAKNEPPVLEDEPPVLGDEQHAAPVPAPAVSLPNPAAPGAWAAVTWTALRDPEHAPEWLAAYAVADIGPRAAAWVAWLRATYPTASPGGIATLAARQARRSGPVLSATARAGRFAALIPLPALGWVRASLVLRVAAAYGHDPVDPRRVPELIELLGLPRGRKSTGAAGAGDGSGSGTRAWYGSRIAWDIGLRAAGSFLFGRVGPAAVVFRALVGAVDESDQIERLAHRAVQFYRHDQGPGRPSRSPKRV